MALTKTRLISAAFIRILRRSNLPNNLPVKQIWSSNFQQLRAVEQRYQDVKSSTVDPLMTPQTLTRKVSGALLKMTLMNNLILQTLTH